MPVPVPVAVTAMITVWKAAPNVPELANDA
jgi:hypothetical protein